MWSGKGARERQGKTRGLWSEREGVGGDTGGLSQACRPVPGTTPTCPTTIPVSAATDPSGARLAAVAEGPPPVHRPRGSRGCRTVLPEECERIRSSVSPPCGGRRAGHQWTAARASGLAGHFPERERDKRSTHSLDQSSMGRAQSESTVKGHGCDDRESVPM